MRAPPTTACTDFIALKVSHWDENESTPLKQKTFCKTRTLTLGSWGDSYDGRPKNNDLSNILSMLESELLQKKVYKLFRKLAAGAFRTPRSKLPSIWICFNSTSECKVVVVQSLTYEIS